MKRSTTAVIVGVLALGLVGGGTAVALSNSGEPAPETSATAPAPVGTDAPVEAATDAPVTPGPVVTADAPSAPLAQTDPEAAYLIEVHARLARIQTQIPDVTDSELLALAHKGCEALAPDRSGENLSLIESEELSPHGYYMDSGAIIVAARLTICPIPD